jgi:hypothetical protein
VLAPCPPGLLNERAFPGRGSIGSCELALGTFDVGGRPQRNVEQANTLIDVSEGMDAKTIKRMSYVSASITFAAFVFYLFFQINKGGPFRAINPFAEDPYDAVGSFAVQGSLLIGILTFARALRLCDDPAQAGKMRLIIRGNGLVLFAILITLVTDAVAVLVHPLPPSYWGKALLIELASMFVLVLVCVIAFITVAWRIQTGPAPRHLTPADGLDDLWTLIRVPVTKARVVLPHSFVEWVERFESDRLFTRVQSLNPRTHAWRFACVVGLLVGIALFGAQLQEGLPPSLRIGLVVAAIFLFAEFTATVLGFALLGRYLGLRPS